MSTITFKIDEKTKQEATELFNSMGLDLSSALRLFIKQSLISRSIPFTIKADELSLILNEANQDINMSRPFSNVKSLMKDLDD